MTLIKLEVAVKTVEFTDCFVDPVVITWSIVVGFVFEAEIVDRLFVVLVELIELIVVVLALVTEDDWNGKLVNFDTKLSKLDVVGFVVLKVVVLKRIFWFVETSIKIMLVVVVGMAAKVGLFVFWLVVVLVFCVDVVLVEVIVIVLVVEAVRVVEIAAVVLVVVLVVADVVRLDVLENIVAIV